MVKSYLRYQSISSFGIISGAGSNVCFDESGKIAICGAVEDVILWNVKQGSMVGRWHESDNKSEVTFICKSPNGKEYAVGYNDGSIRIWDITNNTSHITFTGHKSAITHLTFDKTGSRLASGAKDTDIIIWDLISERGLFRLRGHNALVSGVRFLEEEDNIEEDNQEENNEEEDNGNENNRMKGRGGRLNHLISCSKDSILKIWDLTTQHCIETTIVSRSECWSLDICRQKNLVMTGGGDQEFKVWKLNTEVVRRKLETVDVDANGDEIDEQNDMIKRRCMILHGSIIRQSKDRVMSIQVHPTGRYIAVQAADKSIEVYKIRNEEEIKKKLQRRKKRQKEKSKEKATATQEEQEITQTFEDEIVLLHILRSSSKVRSFDFSPLGLNGADESFNMLIGLFNNSLEVHTCALASKEEPSKLVSTIDMQGHRSDIRCVAISNDDEMLVTGSANGIKIWNIQTGQCIRSMESSGYALSVSFIPGDRHVIVGTKTGELEIFDLGSSELIERVKAHEGPIWSLQVRPDKKGLVTGSADKDVKEWDFQLVDDSNGNGKRRLTLTHIRTLRMSDDVLCVRYSPDQRLLAVSLLDSTVKIFYHDTLKFFLSLYGHKLPVLSMDISSDSTMIATGSADKTIKLWGLDFGDCHRSLLAHDDSVTNIQFVWGTHYLFSCSKDRVVKYWDCDRWECIQKLEGHHSEVWGITITKWGKNVISGGAGKELRLWEKTSEQFFLEEERDKEMDNMYEEAILQESNAKFDAPIGSGVNKDGEEDNENHHLTTSYEKQEVGDATIKTMESLKSGEKIMEACQVYVEEVASWSVYKTSLDAWKASGKKEGQPVPPSRNPWIIAMGKLDISPEEYVLKVIEKVRSAELEEALLVLPFEKVVLLLEIITKWVKKSWNIPLSSRILFNLLTIHHNQLIATRSTRQLLTKLKTLLRHRITQQKNMIGYNLVALQYLKREWEMQHSAEFYDDVVVGEVGKKKDVDDGKKRKRFNLASQ